MCIIRDLFEIKLRIESEVINTSFYAHDYETITPK